MDPRPIPNLDGYLQTAASSADHEERACAQNFLLDERPLRARPLCTPHTAPAPPISDLDDWFGRHQGYAIEHLHIDSDEPQVPYTFRSINVPNRVTRIDPRLYLIQVEDALADGVDDWAVQLRNQFRGQCTYLSADYR